MPKLNGVLFAVFISVIILSCSKNVQQNPAPEVRCFLDSQTSDYTISGVERKQSTQYFYDNHGQWISEKYYNNGVLINMREYEYESGGNHKVRLCRTRVLSNSEATEYRIRYNQQGQISGYQAEYTDPALNNEVFFVRGNDLFTSYTVRNNDTTNKDVYFYKNGNAVRVEYWVNGKLKFFDSLEYDNQVRLQQFNVNTQIFSPGYAENKNHMTRFARYEMPSGYLVNDDRMKYYLNADGTVDKVATRPASSSSSDSVYRYSHYSCR